MGFRHKNMQRCLALGIVLLALGLPQVYCGDESLSYVVRPLNATEKCLNATVIHPSEFEECPLPPFPIVNKDYTTAKKEVLRNGKSARYHIDRASILIKVVYLKDSRDSHFEVPNIKLTKSKLLPECYEIVLKTICIMSVEICTADRYSVGMFGFDVCMEYMECAKADFGDSFLQSMCGFLVEDYTSQPYNGTDPPIYIVTEKKEETESRASSVYKSAILHVVLIVMVLKLLGQY